MVHDEIESLVNKTKGGAIHACQKQLMKWSREHPLMTSDIKVYILGSKIAPKTRCFIVGQNGQKTWDVINGRFPTPIDFILKPNTYNLLI